MTGQIGSKTAFLGMSKQTKVDKQRAIAISAVAGEKSVEIKKKTKLSPWSGETINCQIPKQVILRDLQQFACACIARGLYAHRNAAASQKFFPNFARADDSEKRLSCIQKEPERANKLSNLAPHIERTILVFVLILFAAHSSCITMHSKCFENF